MKETSRSIAVRALLEVNENQGYSNLVIDKLFKNFQLEKRDRALASAIFYGTLEKRITLRFYLKQCLRDSSKKIDPVVDMILLSAVYQILYLDKIPASASVNEAVNLAKQMRKYAYSGFINGVLRGLIRKEKEIMLPQGDSNFALSIRYSVPKELVTFWKRAYGIEITEKLLVAFSEKAAQYIRVNPIKTTATELIQELEVELVSANAHSSLQNAVVVDQFQTIQSLIPFLEGKFHVQDLSAQYISALAAPKPGEVVIDCCAAPGGKTFTMAEYMHDQGEIFATDLHETRLELLESGAERLGLSMISTHVHDFTNEAEKLPLADLVLCDVPCSGYGVIRKKPEIRYKSPEQFRQIPEVQYQILMNASKLVKPGGRLLYSTCTLNPAENGAVVDHFLKANKDFVPMPLDLIGDLVHAIDEPSHQLTIFPFAGGSDGSFVAKIQKVKIVK